MKAIKKCRKCCLLEICKLNLDLTIWMVQYNFLRVTAVSRIKQNSPFSSSAIFRSIFTNILYKLEPVILHLNIKFYWTILINSALKLQKIEKINSYRDLEIEQNSLSQRHFQVYFVQHFIEICAYYTIFKYRISSKNFNNFFL